MVTLINTGVTECTDNHCILSIRRWSEVTDNYPIDIISLIFQYCKDCFKDYYLCSKDLCCRYFSRNNLVVGSVSNTSVILIGNKNRTLDVKFNHILTIYILKKGTGNLSCGIINVKNQNNQNIIHNIQQTGLLQYTNCLNAITINKKSLLFAEGNYYNILQNKTLNCKDILTTLFIKKNKNNNVMFMINDKKLHSDIQDSIIHWPQGYNPSYTISQPLNNIYFALRITPGWIIHIKYVTLTHD